jgi:glycosyltransferase involved in cell wall biosynthesis
LTEPRATVVVCTRNRSAPLAEACEGALALDAAFGWELLIVDNASTDDTREVAAAIVARHPGRARLVVEPTLGLSAARNLGLRLARGHWIAFLDDDAVPAAGWLDAYARAFDDGAVAAAGGPVDPDFRGALPGWFGAELLPYVSAWERGPEPHRLAYNEYPRGANMAYRREALARVGEFDPRLGRRGRSLRSCEEIELCLRLERSGLAVVYEPGARVRHRVEADRLTPGWIVARFAAQGFSEAIVDWKHFGVSGVRRGLARQREAVEHHARARGSSDLLVQGHRAALRAYRNGILYAVVAVPRWVPAP